MASHGLRETRGGQRERKRERERGGEGEGEREIHRDKQKRETVERLCEAFQLEDTRTCVWQTDRHTHTHIYRYTLTYVPTSMYTRMCLHK